MLPLAAAACESQGRIESWLASFKHDEPAAQLPPAQTFAVVKPDESPGSQRIRELALNLEVVRLEGPRGCFSRNERLWDALDEVAGTADKVLALRDNGFRVATGSAAVRLTLRDQLASIPGLRVAHERAVPHSDAPIEVNVSDHDRDLAVFVFDSAGVMRGTTFADARPIFLLRFAIVTSPDPVVRLDVTPEIRRLPGPSKFVLTPAGYQAQPQYRGQMFDAVSARATLANGAFLVLGPMPAVHETPLLASPFLVSGDEAQLRESLYVFIPQVGQSESWWQNLGGSQPRPSP